VTRRSIGSRLAPLGDTAGTFSAEQLSVKGVAGRLPWLAPLGYGLGGLDVEKPPVKAVVDGQRLLASLGHGLGALDVEQPSVKCVADPLGLLASLGQGGDAAGGSRALSKLPQGASASDHAAVRNQRRAATPFYGSFFFFLSLFDLFRLATGWRELRTC
jgi:hypothetical protein